MQILNIKHRNYLHVFSLREIDEEEEAKKRKIYLHVFSFI